MSRAAHFHPQLGPAGEDTPHQNPPIGFVFSNLAQSPSPWALEWAVGFVFTSCRRSAGKPHPTRVALALPPVGVVAHHQPAVGFVFSTLPNGLCPGQSNNPLASFFQAAGLHPKWLRCAKTPFTPNLVSQKTPFVRPFRPDSRISLASLRKNAFTSLSRTEPLHATGSASARHPLPAVNQESKSARSPYSLSTQKTDSQYC